MILSEQERNDISSQHNSDETLPQLMIHLRRHYPVKTANFEFLPNPKKYIVIDDKMKFLENNKKNLTNLLYWDIIEKFRGYPESILRRTIKRFLTLVSD